MSREEEVRAYYESLHDEQLIKIATEEADDLSDLGYEILNEELARRGLFGGEIELDNSPPDDEEILYFVELLEKLPCPGCGNQHEFLKSRRLREVVSAVILTNTMECTVIGCEKCITKWDEKVRLKTYLFGWWSFHGIFRTLGAAWRNWEASKARAHESAVLMQSFVYQNIGYLRAYQNNEEQLMVLLNWQNENRY